MFRISYENVHELSRLDSGKGETISYTGFVYIGRTYRGVCDLMSSIGRGKGDESALSRCRTT
jgi:predicted NAD/FAD-binding protein